MPQLWMDGSRLNLLASCTVLLLLVWSALTVVSIGYRERAYGRLSFHPPTTSRTM